MSEKSEKQLTTMVKWFNAMHNKVRREFKYTRDIPIMFICLIAGSGIAILFIALLIGLATLLPSSDYSTSIIFIPALLLFLSIVACFYKQGKIGQKSAQFFITNSINKAIEQSKAIKHYNTIGADMNSGEQNILEDSSIAKVIQDHGFITRLIKLSGDVNYVEYNQTIPPMKGLYGNITAFVELERGQSIWVFSCYRPYPKKWEDGWKIITTTVVN
jgi:hypothetical protein